MELGIDQIAALSGWLYLIVFAIAALDAVIPVMPSESIVITGAVLAAQGRTSIGGILLAAALGALAGDAASYALGRRVRTRKGEIEPGGRTGKAFRWARRMLDEHGPGTLIVARFVPGGRTATTFTAGLTRMPVRPFVASIGAGAALWAGQAGAIGFLGGKIFQDDLAAGIALGLGSGVLVGLLVELARHRLSARPARAVVRPRSAAAPTSHVRVLAVPALVPIPVPLHRTPAPRTTTPGDLAA
jgi:membrane protein DedA with SNARE-associated domain